MHHTVKKGERAYQACPAALPAHGALCWSLQCMGLGSPRGSACAVRPRMHCSASPLRRSGHTQHARCAQGARRAAAASPCIEPAPLPNTPCAAQLRGQDRQQWPKDDEGRLLPPEPEGTLAEVSGDLLVLAVGNGRQAGGGVPLCPDAGALPRCCPSVPAWHQVPSSALDPALLWQACLTASTSSSAREQHATGGPPGSPQLCLLPGVHAGCSRRGRLVSSRLSAALPIEPQLPATQ